jgi:hypothetical protein
MWQYPHICVFRFATRRGSNPGPWGLIPQPSVEWHCMQSRWAWHEAQLSSPWRAAWPCWSSHSGCALWKATSRRPEAAVFDAW